MNQGTTGGVGGRDSLGVGLVWNPIHTSCDIEMFQPLI